MRSVLCSAIAILFLAPSALSAQSTSTQPLRDGKLTVWVSSSEQFGWDSLFSELRHDFPNLQLDWKRFAPPEFLPAIQNAQASSSLPDAVFIDNASQGHPFTRSVAVRTLAGHPRHSESGWWYVVKEASNLAQANAFFLWLEEPANWQPSTSRRQLLPAGKKANISQAATQIMQARLQSSRPSGDHLDPSLASFNWDWPPLYSRSAPTQTSPAVLQLGGNEHLAFVTVATRIDTDEFLGVVHSFLLFRNDSSGWKLIFFDDNDSIEGITRMVNRFDNLPVSTLPSQSATSIAVRAPADEASLARFPKPWLVFSVNSPPDTLIGIESQYYDPGNRAWSPTRIDWVRAAPDAANVIRTLAPFGVGYQPHRWRVWAVDKTGTLTLSEWRTINFTN